MNSTPRSRFQPGLAQLEAEEKKLIDARRKQAGYVGRPSLEDDRVGVALSGGGIRSATFCLGLFQGLAEHKLIQRIDYLSTVSGGGYFGGFLGRLFTSDWMGDGSQQEAPATPQAGGNQPRGLRDHRTERASRFLAGLRGKSGVERVTETLCDSNSPPLRWLRESGNYLTPGGSGDAALAGAVFLRNWLAVLTVLLTSFLTLFVFSNLARAYLDSWGWFHDYELILQDLTSHHLWYNPWSLLAAVPLGLVVIPVGLAYWLTQADEKGQFITVALANLLTIGVGVFAIRLLPQAGFFWPAVVLGCAAGLALVWIWLLGAFRCWSRSGRKLLPEFRFVVGIWLVCGLPVLWRLVIRPEGGGAAWLLAGLILVAGLHYLALRTAAAKETPGQEAKSWIGCWEIGEWIRELGTGVVVATVVICLVPAGLTGFATIVQEPRVASLLSVWTTLVFLGGFFLIGYEVLRKDRQSSRDREGGGDMDLTPWLKNRLSVWLKRGLMATGCFLLLALVDALGQSCYAVVAYTGGGQAAGPALAGLLGLTALAPLVRSLAVRSGAVAGRLRVPVQVLALGGAALLAFLFMTTLSFVSHGIAWRWGCPVFETTGTTSSIQRRIVEDWRPRRDTGSGDHDQGPALGQSPGAKIYQRLASQEKVALTEENLIQVKPIADTPQPWKPRTRMAVLDLGLSFVLGATLTLLFGRTVSFLNLSSFHTLYTARLVRAYLGASNARRWAGPEASITEVDERDDLDWHRYRPHEQGGPLHLVNVTVNSTVSLETNMESVTAKGLNLCVGPAGISFGQRHSLASDPGGWRNRPALALPPGQEVHLVEGTAGVLSTRKIEPLSLGSWVGISGAAFTTALGNVGGGAGTSLGTSLLCGLFNVRLGYWWRNGFSPSTRSSGDRYFPVQTYLLDELTGSFRIEHRNQWYLSDGGHFENTGAYELIRRQVPCIILADCGADAEGEFDDLANLVRRVRLDFGAEVEFLDDAALRRWVHPAMLAPCVAWRGGDGGAQAVTGTARAEETPEPMPKAGRIGTLDDLRPRRESPESPRRVRAHAALAQVTYPNRPEQGSVLLVVKPGVTGDLPADLLNYQLAEPDFPQQSTLDQFFDEAQWESYRKLGQLIAHALFQSTSAGSGWTPAQVGHHPLNDNGPSRSEAG